MPVNDNTVQTSSSDRCDDGNIDNQFNAGNSSEEAVIATPICNQSYSLLDF